MASPSPSHPARRIAVCPSRMSLLALGLTLLLAHSPVAVCHLPSANNNDLPGSSSSSISSSSAVAERATGVVEPGASSQRRERRLLRLPNGCIIKKSFRRTRNYFPASDRLDVSAFSTQPSFTVLYRNWYKIVRDAYAGTTYVLVQCGAPAPTAAELAQDSVDASALVLTVPLKAYVLNSDVPAAYLQLLGELRDLKAVSFPFLVDPCLQKIGNGLPTANTGPFPQFSAFFSPASYMGLNISFSATFERTPLARAEWVRYMSLFFNKESQADRIFASTVNSYTCLSVKAQSQNPVRPTVGWLSFFGGSWTLSAAQYKRQFVVDAGANNPAEVSAGSSVQYDLSVAADLAAFKTLLTTLDFVIDETYLPSGPASYSLAVFTANAQLTSVEAAQLSFLNPSSPGVWSIYGQYTPSFFIGWFEDAVAQAQTVLQEIVSFVHPSLVVRGYKNTFLYNVGLGSPNPVTAANCRAWNPYAPVAPEEIRCRV